VRYGVVVGGKHFDHVQAEAFGRLIRTSRAVCQESLEALGQRCSPPIHKFRLSRLERGKAWPRPEEKAALVAALPALRVLERPALSPELATEVVSTLVQILVNDLTRHPSAPVLPTPSPPAPSLAAPVYVGGLSYAAQQRRYQREAKARRKSRAQAAAAAVKDRCPGVESRDSTAGR
jgi:hypothetical protein